MPDLADGLARLVRPTRAPHVAVREVLARRVTDGALLGPGPALLLLLLDTALVRVLADGVAREGLVIDRRLVLYDLRDAGKGKGRGGVPDGLS